LLAAGCGDQKPAVTRLSPRSVPYLEGVPVPAKFVLVDKMTEDYESGGQRTARHEYRGSADLHSVREFYREQMPLLGWARVTDQNVKGAVNLRFERKNESCNVEISEINWPAAWFNRTSIQVVVNPFNRSSMEPPRRPMP